MQDPVNQFSEAFDGRFYFTNSSDEDFTSKWANVEYTFPAKKMSPIIIPTATLEETQNIRKKFAREYAEREFYKSARLKQMESPVGQGESLHSALTYVENDLVPFIQSCLQPLPIAAAKVEEKPKKQYKLRTDDEGKPVTKVLKSDKESLTADSVPAF